MKKVSVRLANESDAEQFLECELNTPNNLFDPSAGLYKNSFTLVAENENGPRVFVPIQMPFQMESLGIAKDATNKEVAVSLRRLMDKIIELANQSGTGEIYFECKEP